MMVDDCGLRVLLVDVRSRRGAEVSIDDALALLNAHRITASRGCACSVSPWRATALGAGTGTYAVCVCRGPVFADGPDAGLHGVGGKHVSTRAALKACVWVCSSGLTVAWHGAAGRQRDVAGIGRHRCASCGRAGALLWSFG